MSEIKVITPEQQNIRLTKYKDYLRREFKTTSIVYSMNDQAKEYEVIPFRSFSINHALGIWGFPYGRIIEIFGPESSGKTTVCLETIAEAQKSLRLVKREDQNKKLVQFYRTPVVHFIDVEHSLDPKYAGNLGVDVDALLVSQPDYGEQALQLCEMSVLSGEVDIIVVDSIAALIPKAELEGEIGDTHVGLQARMMSQAMRKLTGIIHRSNVLVIFTNQIRDKIQKMGYGDPTTTPGGRAMKFYASIRIKTSRTGDIKDASGKTGINCIAKVVKNKCAPPFKEAEFQIMFGKGIDPYYDVITLGVQCGLIDKSGAWFSTNTGERIGQGIDKSAKFLESNPHIYWKLRLELLELMNAPPLVKNTFNTLAKKELENYTPEKNELILDQEIELDQEDVQNVELTDKQEIEFDLE